MVRKVRVLVLELKGVGSVSLLAVRELVVCLELSDALEIFFALFVNLERG